VGYTAQHIDLLVTHQWQHEHYHLCLDALYGGYPVVHNAPFFQSGGYYYPEFDIAAGAQCLLAAATHHDADLDGYHRRTRQLIDGCSPLSAENSARYARRLLALQSKEH
jgi:hypothetical protein